MIIEDNRNRFHLKCLGRVGFKHEVWFKVVKSERH